MSEFKAGDRVRTTMIREGVVEDANEKGVTFRQDRGLLYFVVYGDGHVVEKLAPAEPEWAKGDVIRTLAPGGTQPHSLVYNGAEWKCSCRGGREPAEYVSYWWRAGKVEILLKADEQ